MHVVADNCRDRTVQLRHAGRGAGARPRRPGRPREGCRAELAARPSRRSRCTGRRVRRRRRRHDRRRPASCAPWIAPSRRGRWRRRASTTCAIRPARRRHRCVPQRSPAGTTSARSAATRSVRRAGCTATAWRSPRPCSPSTAGQVISTEDLEMQVALLLDGRSVAYVPDAKVAAEMPDSLEASVTQHQRWEAGRAQVLRTELPRLLGALRRGEGSRLAVADTAADLLVPPLSVLVAAQAVAGAASAAAYVLAPTPARRAVLAVNVGQFGRRRRPRVRRVAFRRRAGEHLPRPRLGAANGAVEAGAVAPRRCRWRRRRLDAHGAQRARRRREHSRDRAGAGARHPDRSRDDGRRGRRDRTARRARPSARSHASGRHGQCRLRGQRARRPGCPSGAARRGPRPGGRDAAGVGGQGPRSSRPGSGRRGRPGAGARRPLGAHRAEGALLRIGSRCRRASRRTAPRAVARRAV